jgi:activator of HSP90 ATPase
MKETTNTAPLAFAPTRRQLVTDLAVALGSLATVSVAFGKAQQSPPRETPGTAANRKRTALHQEVHFTASPQRIYEVLLDAKQFAAFTKMPAEIDPKVGGALSIFGGMIVGRNVELIPNRRIVQAWRPSRWDPGVYSIVRFELKEQGAQTTVVLDHTGFPEGPYDSRYDGWPLRYWEPLKKFLL